MPNSACVSRNLFAHFVASKENIPEGMRVHVPGSGSLTNDAYLWSGAVTDDPNAALTFLILRSLPLVDEIDQDTYDSYLAANRPAVGVFPRLRRRRQPRDCSADDRACGEICRRVFCGAR
eukprot:Rmarinus@m.21273